MRMHPIHVFHHRAVVACCQHPTIEDPPAVSQYHTAVPSQPPPRCRSQAATWMPYARLSFSAAAAAAAEAEAAAAAAPAVAAAPLPLRCPYLQPYWHRPHACPCQHCFCPCLCQRYRPQSLASPLQPHRTSGPPPPNRYPRHQTLRQQPKVTQGTVQQWRYAVRLMQCRQSYCRCRVHDVGMGAIWKWHLAVRKYKDRASLKGWPEPCIYGVYTVLFGREITKYTVMVFTYSSGRPYNSVISGDQWP